MIAFFRKIFHFQNSTEQAAIMLTDLLDVKITKTTLINELEEHPDFPRFLSISDVLNNYGISNVIASYEVDKLHNLPLPSIALIKGEADEQSFTVIKRIKNGNFTLFDFKKNIWKVLDGPEFKKIFLDEVLYIEVSEYAGEKEYEKKLKEERNVGFIQQFTTLYIPSVTIIVCIMAFFRLGTNALFPVIYTLLSLAGLVVSALLLLYQYNRHNPVLQQICSSGKNINCGNILDSKASKIAGISWSTLGFSYFMGQLLLILFFGMTNPLLLFVMSWLSIIVIPYTFFSIYYQWQVAKQWCVLCVLVQAILLLEFIIPFISSWHNLSSIANIIPDQIPSIITAFALPFITITVLMQALEKAKEIKQSKRDLHFLKRNSEIFEALLSKQEAITEPVDGLGITLGNSDARYKIIKVSNPYCEPCAKTHIAIDELLQNSAGEVQVREIYLASNNKNDKATPPVKHLLAIAEQGDENQVKQALNDWYATGKKNYDAFAAKYPLNGELKMQDEKINQMFNWCMQMKITSTPVFFINGYMLPKVYKIDDIKYFLTED